MKDRRIAPISVRATAEERALLVQFSEAAGMSLSGYMKWCSLERDKHNAVKLPITRRRNPTIGAISASALLTVNRLMPTRCMLNFLIYWKP